MRVFHVFGQCPECAQPGNLAVHRTIRRNAIGLKDACPLRLIEAVSLGHAGSLAIGVWLHLRKPTYRAKLATRTNRCWIILYLSCDGVGELNEF
jgi:hypothetical protein